MERANEREREREREIVGFCFQILLPDSAFRCERESLVGPWWQVLLVHDSDLFVTVDDVALHFHGSFLKKETHCREHET